MLAFPNSNHTAPAGYLPHSTAFCVGQGAANAFAFRNSNHTAPAGYLSHSKPSA